MIQKQVALVNKKELTEYCNLLLVELQCIVEELEREVELVDSVHDEANVAL